MMEASETNVSNPQHIILKLSVLMETTSAKQDNIFLTELAL